MQVRVLGTAAGGGVPQWNCACTRCRAAREGRLPRRLEASIAVSVDGTSWAIFNATSDLTRQLDRNPSLQPKALRHSPLRAVFLTDANVDHCAGLLSLRQATALVTYSTEAVRRAVAEENILMKPFAHAPRSWRAVGTVAVAVGPVQAPLSVRAIEVPGLMPVYAGAAPDAGAAVAYRIEDGRGASLLYAPIFSGVSPSLMDAVGTVDRAFLDGTFFTDTEMIDQGLGTRTARAMGHMPIGGPDGSLAAFAHFPSGRILFTHVNNSNPVLDPASPERAAIERAGMAVADEDVELVLSGNA